MGLRFKTILADPPWEFQARSLGGMGRAAEKHYPVMDHETMCALPVEAVCEKHAELLLWCPWTHLVEGLEVMRRWGFTYVTGFPWLKMNKQGLPRRGMGYHFAQVTEPCLIGKRGNGVCDKDREGKQIAIMFHPPGPHSEKPQDQYLMAEAYPGPYLELFARPTWGLLGPRDGWVHLGNEVTGNDIRDDLRSLVDGRIPIGASRQD